MKYFQGWKQPDEGNTTAISIILLLSLLIGFMLISRYAVRQQSKQTCLKWGSYQQYPNFKISPKMNEFCSHYGVEFSP